MVSITCNSAEKLPAMEQAEQIESLVIDVPVVTSEQHGEFVHTIFENMQEVEGVIVLADHKPVGLIMRTFFYQKIGTLYGHSMFMKRPIKILMEQNLMIVDAKDIISDIGIQAMGRSQSKLYDYIVVLKNGKYIGVVSIRLFLIELSRRREKQLNILDFQHKELVRANQAEVVLRKEIERKSEAEKNLLDNAGQGFLSIGPDLVIKEEFSKECRNIFKQNIGGLYYVDLVSAYFDAEKLDSLKIILDSYFKNTSAIKDDAYLLLMPGKCVIHNKTIRFEYKKVISDNEKSVMVILTDITEKIEFERKMEEERNNQRLMMKAFSCKSQIKNMMLAFSEFFTGNYRQILYAKKDAKECLGELYRNVHTYKGDFAQYGFFHAASRLHVFEEQLHAMQSANKIDICALESISRNVDPNELLEDDLSIIKSILGKDYFCESETLQIPVEQIDEMERLIKKCDCGPDITKILEIIRNIKLTNIKTYLNNYEDYIMYLSARLGKNMPEYKVLGDPILIDEKKYRDILKSLIHIFRNSVDHGIETAEERIECGKKESGHIQCRLKDLNNGTFQIVIEDDGRGIPVEKIIQSAIEKNLYTQDQIKLLGTDQIINIIFADGFSTKKETDSLSGRGMGMSALKSECEKLGGSVTISSGSGAGTTFEITLPFLD